MKFLIKLGAFIAIFLVVLIWRFPYDALVEKAVRRAESATGATIIYQPVSAGPLGVKVSDLHINLRSGASLHFDSARIFPTRQGLSTTAYQGENEMKVTLTRTELNLELTEIAVETGSADFGKAKVTGNLAYQLVKREGNGALRLVIPELKLPLPMSDPMVEIGSTYTIRNIGTPQAPRTGVSAEVKLLNKDFNGNGTISLEGQPPPAAPNLNGNLRFERGEMRGAIQLSGSWDKPTTKIIPN